MKRIYFYAEPAGVCWEVCTRDDSVWRLPIRYPSRIDAIEGATRLACAEWTATHYPTGVRVWQDAGGWKEEISFGC